MQNRQNMSNIIKINDKVKIYAPNDCCNNAIGEVKKIYNIDEKIWYDICFCPPVHTKLRVIKRGLFSKNQLTII